MATPKLGQLDALGLTLLPMVANTFDEIATELDRLNPADWEPAGLRAWLMLGLDVLDTCPLWMMFTDDAVRRAAPTVGVQREALRKRLTERLEALNA